MKKMDLDNLGYMIHLIATEPAPAVLGLAVGDTRLDTEILACDRDDAVWDHVRINGKACGNRHGGRKVLVDAFAEIHGITYGKED